MAEKVTDVEALIPKLTQEIIDHLNLEDVDAAEVDPDDQLFGEGLGLDSIDALELIVLLEKNYGVTIENPKEGKEIFYSVRTIAEYIKNNQK